MKKLIWLLLVCAAFAQGPFPASDYYAEGAPSPGTAQQIGSRYVDIKAGQLYVCTSTTYANKAITCNWTNIASSSSVSFPGLITSGLVAEYRMTEGSGTTLTDSSGNGNTATFGSGGNAPSWNASPQLGLSFANGQYVDVPAAATPTSAVTAMVFFDAQPEANGTYGSPIFNNTSGTGSFGILLQNLAGGIAPTFWCNGGSVIAPTTNSGVAITKNLPYAWAGAGAMTIVNDTVNGEQLWWNNVPYVSAATACTSGVAGHLRIGGTSSGNGAPVDVYLTGKVYYVAIWNRVLSNAEVIQQWNYVQDYMRSRQVSVTYPVNTNPVDVLVAEGDSITAGQGATPYTTNIVLGGTINIFNAGFTGKYSQAGRVQWPYVDLPYISTKASRCVNVIWLGRNDIVAGGSLTAGTAWGDNVAMAQMARNAGCRSVAVSVLSSANAAGDTAKNAFNLLARTNWSKSFDGFADVAADVNIGADGTFSNATYFQGDLVHPTSQAQINNVTPVIQRAVNRLFGNTSFSTATTYTTAAAAAVATTAGSESTNTMTFTFSATPANCQVGNQIVIAGVTPAGYNSPTGGAWTILTRSATQVTAFNGTTGLGAISVQGTGVCPQQQDADQYIILGGSATTPSFTLESCVGYTGQNLYIKNANTTSPWVLTPFASETIDGASTLTMPTASSGNNPVVVLQSTLVSSADGGCNWKRLQ
jgi:hypothetical protein